MSTRYIVVQDPFHDYAVRFIQHIHEKHGYRAIGFFSARHEYFRQIRAFPSLQSGCMAAWYEVQPQQLQAFADHLRARFDIAAVIPFNEPTVSAAVELSHLLGLSWSQPEIMRRFRDKFALKDYLRTRDASLRLNAVRRVSTLDEVLQARALPEFARFVLKPNDGFGNRAIGMFDAHSKPEAIQEYLGASFGEASGQVLMEEYIGGSEYFVNGQVDAAGRISVVGGFEYQRIAANGRTNIDFETRKLAQDDSRFAMLVSYAEQVLRASGLLRSPFHLEAKVDAQGPCLIEVAARLPGLNNAVLCGELHGNDLDLFALAAHYYLHAHDYGPLPLNWHNYNATAVRYVHGIATRDERIQTLDGVAQVAALAEFAGWVKKPHRFERVHTTVDCLSMPWNVIVKAPNEARAAQAAADIRGLIKWNAAPRFLARLNALLTSVSRRGVAAIRVRLLSLLMPWNEKITVLNQPTAAVRLHHLWSQLSSRYVNAVMRRLQLLRFGKDQHTSTLPDIPAEYAGVAAAAVRWAEEYLAKPHPDLGRKGPICPFVKHTVDIGRYFVSVQSDIDGRSIHALRRVVIAEASAFLKRSPNVGSKGAFGSLVMVFPNIVDARLGILDQLHDELKTPLMERDLMFSPFHKHSTKPSISNPEFKVFRTPFPALVVRHLDVRDIAFLNMNRKAFLHFRSRYAPMFAQGKVSNEFGYVRLYEEACARFGIQSGA